MTLLDFDAERLEERPLTDAAVAASIVETDTITWINVDGLHRVEVIERLGVALGLHPLVLEDILNTHQRPKVEDLETRLFLVLRMLTYDATADEIIDEQVSLVLGPHFVLSFQERPGDVFDGVRGRIRGARGRLRKRGSDYLTYALLDAIVDGYFPVLDRLSQRMEDLEDELIADPTPQTLHGIYDLRRDLLALERAVRPAREVVSELLRMESDLVLEETVVFLRDVYDHALQVLDSAETLREITTNMLDTYLSSVSNRMNEVMKVLTIIATIFIPLGFLAGVYGMNFQNMPELAVPWAYFVVIGTMALIGVGMLLFFRRRRWF